MLIRLYLLEAFAIIVRFESSTDLKSLRFTIYLLEFAKFYLIKMIYVHHFAPTINGSSIIIL